ncbi:elongation factor Tu, mitochondrial [Nephila pilipes]|uniref:Elongation factor Tu, mitochondrial n=1 Tax=Nephila pilipes TaxID=299642 RepID=A0A8X6J8I4_NEPPI|nr:elongation factor Tu, mitochondrial [Nephila pilipes]
MSLMMPSQHHTQEQKQRALEKVVMVSLHEKKFKLERIRRSKRKEFNYTFPNEEPSDIKIGFPELQDLDPIQLFGKHFPKEYIGTLACMTKLYVSQKGVMIAIDYTDIAQFLGLLLLSGYYWVPKEDYYWSSAEDLKVDIVPTVMSRNHFRPIKKKIFFHVNDN